MATPVNSTITPWFTTGAVTSDEMRYALQAMGAADAAAALTAETGVMPALNAAVVQAASTTSVTVQPFQAVVRHSTGAAYTVTFPTSVTIPVDANASNTRLDRLVVEILDSEVTAGDGAKVARLRVVNGTAAASPVEPSIPTGTVELARLAVTSSAITVADRRLYTRARGGARLATSYDTRAGSFPGDRRTFADGRQDVWTGSTWVTASAPVTWTQENTSLTYAGTSGNPSGTVGLGSGGSAIVRYKRVGNDLTVSYAFRWGSPGAYNGGTGPITTTLPGGMTGVGRDQWIPCQIWVNDTSYSGVVLDWQGLALIQAGSNIVRPYFPQSGTGAGTPTSIQPYRIATSPNAPGGSIPIIVNGFAQGGTVHIGPATLEVA